MTAYAGLASLMNNIEQIMDHPRLSASLDSQQIQSLLEKAGSLLDFIEGCNHGGVTSKEVEDLEAQITCAAHAAEDVIESHIVNQIHAGSTQVSLSCSLRLQQMVEDMDDILRKANELKEKQGFGEEQPTYSRRPLMETAMVGFEEELMQLKDKLTNQQSSRDVISIVGMGGTGKTTLTQNLYQDSCIKQHFDIRAWATVSQQYDVQGILSQLFSHLGTVSQSGENLHKTLYDRRYLIILDDIWSIEAWDEVSHFFLDNGNGSWVVLTTRLSDMARYISSSCVTMKPLDDHISWELLCKKAFGQETCPYPELEKVGKEIARLCRGLPLSTVVIGGLLLNSPRSVPFWKKVARNIKSVPGSKEKEESLDILSLSYDHLPPHLKPCFLYMGVFKEDSEIRISDVINLWIAEGFVRRKNTLGLEEVAEGYLKELMDRNLISISKRRKNGKIGSCGIHDLMRDLCLKVGQQQGFFHVLTKGKFRGSTERRLVFPESDGVIHSAPPLGRSIVAWHVHSWVAARCKLLRVCYTELYIRFPETKYINVNLRYLSSPLSFGRDEPVWELPSSVSLLWNLQTLIFREFRVSSDSIVVAPVEIWRMRQLKHVKCSKIFLPTSDGDLFVMDKLQTLKTAVNLKLSEQVCKVIPNIKKLHLLYQGNLHGYDDGLIDFLQNLDCLHKLESLNLSFPLIRQQTTKTELNKKLAFPTCLRKLSLSGCRLGWEDLSMIGSLPELEVLELGISCVMVGSRWSPVDEQFLRLKYLKIDWCSLQYWEADNSHFPVLTKLILSGLRQLKEIPGGIGEIPTLELIRVEYCSDSAAVSAVRMKEDQLEMGNDGLEIQVRIFASVLESFKEKVEAEGLNINDIQLEIR